MSVRLSSIGLTFAMMASAHAQDLGERVVDPRNLGRAGSSTVSGDTGAALIVNPGGMVRRSQPRFLLSTGISDNDASFRATASDESPTIYNRAAPGIAPLVAYHQGNRAGTWVLGAIVLRGASEVSLPAPSFGQPVEDIARLFPHRYGGTEWRASWKRYGLGGALRIGESIGIGASVSLTQIEVAEKRRVWAGFAGRDPLLGAERDLELALAGEDRISPGVSIGTLVAPPSIPFEFALAAEYRRGLRLRDGDVSLDATTPNEFPRTTASSASARLDLPDILILRGGLRYLGKRSFVELCADLQLLPKRSQGSWAIQGMQVTDETTASADITRVPALAHGRRNLALRASVDYEVVLGFLWLTAGYAWTSPASPQRLRTPAFSRLGGHSLATGLEAAYQNYTIMIGYSRTLERSRDVDAETGNTPAFNPFGAGTGPSNQGNYTSSSDRIGLAVEVAWD